MRRLPALALVALVLVPTLAGCGRSVQDIEALRAELEALQARERRVRAEAVEIEEVVEEATTPSTTAKPGEVAAARAEMNVSFWRDEYKVTLGSVRVIQDEHNPRSGKLEVDVVCENLGERDGYCPHQLRVQSKDQFYSGSSTTPLVPAGRRGDDRWRFSVDDKFALEDAVFLIGSSGEHIAVLPVCPGPGRPAPVLLEPVERDLSGTVTAGGVTATLKKMKLQTDRHVNGTRKEDKLTMLITLDATASAEEFDGYYWGNNAFELKRPDGNTSTTERWSGEDQWVNATVIEKDIFLQFEVDNPPAGTYTLTMTMPDAEREDVVGTITFTI